MIFCIPLWIIAITDLCGLLCGPLIGLVAAAGAMFMATLMGQ